MKQMNDHYEILVPQSRGSFAERLEELAGRLRELLTKERSEGRMPKYAKIFLSDIQNQYRPLVGSALFGQLLSGVSTTVVEQPPLDGSKVSLLVKTAGSDDGSIFQSLRLSDEEARGTSAYMQTVRLFEKYLQSIDGRGIDMRTHLVRTWIYVDNIDADYGGVVAARNDIFARYGLTADTHFIASTGIGGGTPARAAAVAMDFLTYPSIAETDKKYLQALDHLNPTHEYGVAFERGTLLSACGRQVAFISGTASIDRHGDVVFLGDVERQTVRLLENIEALLLDGGLTMDAVNYFIIYLRDPSDFAVVDRYMSVRFPQVPRVVVLARVCRPEWLIEMECTAE